ESSVWLMRTPWLVVRNWPLSSRRNASSWRSLLCSLRPSGRSFGGLFIVGEASGRGAKRRGGRGGVRGSRTRREAHRTHGGTLGPTVYLRTRRVEVLRPCGFSARDRGPARRTGRAVTSHTLHSLPLTPATAAGYIDRSSDLGV